MKSQIFYTTAYLEIQQKVLALLNAQNDFLSPNTVHSTRAAGDAIEEIIAASFNAILGEWTSEYSTTFARRAMADFAFKDIDDFYYAIDVKTHRASTKFNMPNLISVERISRFYEDDSNYFVLLLISYDMDESRAIFSDVKFIPIEFLSWECLTVGALGWGQIQIANSNRLIIKHHYSRKKWMLELCEVMMEFYPKEILKITDRIGRFKQIHEYWLTKPDE